MDYYRGQIDGTWWFYLTGDIGRWGWDAYVEHCNHMLDHKGEGLLCVAYRALAPPRESRQEIVHLLRTRKYDFKNLHGFALVADSSLHRAALQVINWMTIKPFKERLFASPRAGAAWLDSVGAQGSRALAQAQRAVPPEHWWAEGER